MTKAKVSLLKYIKITANEFRILLTDVFAFRSVLVSTNFTRI